MGIVFVKKKYIKPTIVDLSMEGMPGFGYDVLSKGCTSGDVFLPSACNGGNGANSSCIGGTSASAGCNPAGQLPVDRGSICWNFGSNATGRTCLVGDTVSGQNAMCGTGVTGTVSFDCTDGPTPNYCVNGNNDVRSFS